MEQSFRMSVSRSLKWLPFLMIPFTVNLNGQDTIQHNWSLNGYITNMQSFIFQNIDGDWTIDNLIHNRLNFKWVSKSGNIKTVLELRNRFIIGESVKADPDYGKMIN